jgi:hypothetical protein
MHVLPYRIRSAAPRAVRISHFLKKAFSRSAQRHQAEAAQNAPLIHQTMDHGPWPTTPKITQTTAKTPSSARQTVQPLQGANPLPGASPFIATHPTS